MGQWSISAFWFGLLIGRLLLAVRQTDYPLQLLAAAGLSGGSVLIVTSTLALGPLAAATALAGLAMGPVYPLIVMLAARSVPAAPATAVGIVTGLGAVGGSFVPWMIGWFGDAFGLQLAVAVLGVNAWIVTLAALTVLRVEAQRRVAVKL
jgi:fucose permease